MGLAAAQAVHAAFQFATEHSSITESWLRDSQYLVIVTVPDEIDLIGLASQAGALDVQRSLWHEPDLGGAATALALAPGEDARRLCARFPLLGRELAVT